MAHGELLWLLAVDRVSSVHQQLLKKIFFKTTGQIYTKLHRTDSWVAPFQNFFKNLIPDWALVSKIYKPTCPKPQDIEPRYLACDII